jgi:hypothetical protein
LFGKKFGNHEQDIMVRTFFEKAEGDQADNDTINQQIYDEH